MRLRALLLIAASSPAYAANQDGVPLSPDAMIIGTTLATHDAGTGAWYNPAALGGISRSSVQVTTSIYTLAIRNIDGLIETRLPWETRHDSLSATNLTTIPSGISFVFRLGPRFGLSLGLFSPVREYWSFDSQISSTRPDGGAVYQQTIALTRRLDSTHGGIGLGWAATDSFRIGASVFFTGDSTETVADYSFSGTVPATGDMLFGGYIDRQAFTQFGVRSVVGAQWDAARWLSLALAVRSPVLGFAASGHETLTGYSGIGPATNMYRIGLYQQQVIQAQPTTFAAPARLSWAAQAIVGPARFALEGDVRHPIDDSTCGGTGQRHCTNGADKWVANARVGGLVQVSDNVWLGLGAFTDMDGHSLEKSGITIDYFGGSAGIQFRTPSVVKLRAGGDPWDLRTQVALRYGVGVGHTTSSILDFNTLMIGPNPQPASMTYHELSLNIGTALEF